MARTRRVNNAKPPTPKKRQQRLPADDPAFAAETQPLDQAGPAPEVSEAGPVLQVVPPPEEPEPAQARAALAAMHRNEQLAEQALLDNEDLIRQHKQDFEAQQAMSKQLLQQRADAKKAYDQLRKARGPHQPHGPPQEAPELKARRDKVKRKGAEATTAKVQLTKRHKEEVKELKARHKLEREAAVQLCNQTYDKWLSLGAPVLIARPGTNSNPALTRAKKTWKRASRAYVEQTARQKHANFDWWKAKNPLVSRDPQLLLRYCPKPFRKLLLLN